MQRHWNKNIIMPLVIGLIVTIIALLVRFILRAKWR